MAFPDGKPAFGAQVYAEDAAAVEGVFTGTHTGPLTTPDSLIPPTGKQVSPPLGAGMASADWFPIINTAYYARTPEQILGRVNAQ